MSDLEWARRCPVCNKIWDKSHRLCPECEGVMLLQVFAYELAYDEGFPEGLVLEVEDEG